MSRKLLAVFLGLAMPVVLTCTAVAAPLNYDPLKPAPAPVLGAGWSYDQVNGGPGIPSVDSPYQYVVPDGQHWKLSITDFFIATDFYQLFDTITGNIVQTALLGALPPLFPIGDPDGNAGWTNAAFSKATMVLGPGAHNIVVTWIGDNYGGAVFPAGFYARIDVPEPATLALLSMGLLGWGVMRRKAAV